MMITNFLGDDAPAGISIGSSLISLIVPSAELWTLLIVYLLLFIWDFCSQKTPTASAPAQLQGQGGIWE